MTMRVEKGICLQPVEELIIMGAGVTAFDPAQVVGFAVKLEKGTHLVIDVRLDQGGPKAAIVLCVMDQKRRPWCAHGDEEWIILSVRQIGRVFFHLRGVTGAGDVRLQRSKPATST